MNYDAIPEQDCGRRTGNPGSSGEGASSQESGGRSSADQVLVKKVTFVS